MLSFEREEIEGKKAQKRSTSALVLRETVKPCDGETGRQKEEERVMQKRTWDMRDTNKMMGGRMKEREKKREEDCVRGRERLTRRAFGAVPM